MDILVERVINRPIDSNSFVIYQQGRTNCIVVDPGTEDCRELFLFLNEHQLDPDYIFLTHEHFDHIWGVNRLKDTYSCKTVCLEECAVKITNIKKNMSVFYNQTGFQTYPADILIEKINYSLEWNDLEFEFIESKGHTNGSMCISVGDMLFTGDTIIKDNRTVIKFPGGSKEELMNSLDLLFSRFDGQNVFAHPGHGESFFLNEITIEQIL